MRVLPLLSVLVLAGCAADDVALSRGAIAGGTPSDLASVVAVITTTGGLCSGVVVGAREVATLRLCVTADASSDGALAAAADLQVQVGPSVSGATAFAVAAVLESGPGGALGEDGAGDIAILRTTEDLCVPALTFSATAPAAGTDITIVGYGQTETGSSGQRLEGTSRITRVDGIRVMASGAAGTCSSDGGGPALDASGAVVGLSWFGSGVCGGGTDGFRAVSDLAAFVEAERTPAPTGCPAQDAGTIPDAGSEPADAGSGTSSDGGCAVGHGRAAPIAGLVLLLALGLGSRRRA